MNYDYSKRGFLLPNGIKNLGAAKQVSPRRSKKYRQPLRTNEEIRQVFARHVPEIASGVVEIVSLVRNAGRRCLLVVRSHDPKISAVDVCSPGRGERLDALVADLRGELPDIMLPQPSPEDFIKSTFCCLSEVVLDPNTRKAKVTPLLHQPVMVRGEDQIVRMIAEQTGLVSELTGWKITVASASQA